MKLESIRRSLTKSLKMDVDEVPLMTWRWAYTPVQLRVLLDKKRLMGKALKKRGNPDYVELFFYGQGMDGPEDIYGCCIDSNLTNTKITDGYTSSWEFKFPKKGFSIVVHWLG